MSDPAPALPACLQYLAEQAACAFGPVGVAATVLPDVEMMRQARTLAPDHVPALEWMLAHAQAGGKIYAALLLAGLGPEQREAAWRQLENVDEWVTVAEGGCGIMRAYVSDFAKSVLRGGPLEGYRQADGTLPTPSPPRPLTTFERISRGVDALKQSPLVVAIPVVLVGAVLLLFYWLRACQGAAP